MSTDVGAADSDGSAVRGFVVMRLFMLIGNVRMKFSLRVRGMLFICCLVRLMEGLCLRWFVSDR